MLKNTPSKLFSAPARVQIPEHFSISDIYETQNQKLPQTGALATGLGLKISVRFMITTNIDITDKLINGQVGIVEQNRDKRKGSLNYIFCSIWQFF